MLPLKRSVEFRSLRSRLAGRAPHPVFDSWMDEGYHFFVFTLASADESDGVRREPGVAVFAMHPESPDVVSAVTIVPTDDAHAEITNLRDPDNAYIAPM